MIEARELWVRRSAAGGVSTAALRGVSLRLEAGELGVLLGPSGAGKTTLLEALAGLLLPTAGAVGLTVGAETWAWGAGDRVPAAARRNIGVLFQHPERQLFGETPLEDVAWGFGAGDTQRAEGALDRVALRPDLWNVPIRILSRGERRRVALAGVLARTPSVLLLDEPYVGLDESGQAMLRSEIEGYRRKRGAAVLVATHWPEEWLPHASSVVCLETGEATFSGTPRGLQAEAARVPNLEAFLPFRWRLSAALKKPGFGAPWRDEAVEWLQEA